MSEVKVNKISPRTNCGTVQLGDSGDTITIPAGATITNNGTQTGFGRTGTVDWQTTKKTAAFTAVNGEGYFVDTTSATITVTAPASPSAGDIFALKDYAGTFATNNVTIGRNGSKFDGVAADPILDTNQLSVAFVYVDSTQGWKSVQSDAGEYGALYVAATGGTVTTCGDFKIHTFTGPGTFTVSCAGNSGGSSTVDYLVVAGGGGGRGNAGNSDGQAGAGAGGYRESSGAASGCYSVSPLGACVSALPVSAQGYPITVGGGGAGGPGSSPHSGSRGANSIFSTITSTGGGTSGPVPESPEAPGGSGGAAGGASNRCSQGIGNTPPVTPPQGRDGGTGANAGPSAGGGGGGATATGGNGTAPSGGAGDGGAGATSSINGTPTTRAGGGGGSAYQQGTGKNGSGGSGGGGAGGDSPGSAGGSGTANTGGGGGAGSTWSSSPSPTVAVSGGTGGSGIVIIRYKFQ